jgi:hypothetical protein
MTKDRLRDELLDNPDYAVGQGQEQGAAIMYDGDGNEILVPVSRAPRKTNRHDINRGLSFLYTPPGGIVAGTIPGAIPRTAPQGVFKTSYDVPTSIELVMRADFIPQPAAAPDFNGRPIAIVTWGVGGTSFSETIDCTPPRGKLSFVAESVEISVQFESVNGAAFSQEVQAQFSGMLCEGVDPDFVTNTLFSFQAPLPATQGPAAATQQIVSTQPIRLQSVTAYDFAGAGAETLMLFDTIAIPGAASTPDLAFPLPAFPGIVNADFGRSPHVFRKGLVWVISTTPYILTFGGNLSRVDIETIR